MFHIPCTISLEGRTLCKDLVGKFKKIIENDIADDLTDKCIKSMMNQESADTAFFLNFRTAVKLDHVIQSSILVLTVTLK